MADLLVRNVPPATLEALKERAAKNRRSLQQEVLGILEAGARATSTQTPAQVAAAIRSRLAQSGRVFGDSVEMVREDRKR